MKMQSANRIKKASKNKDGKSIVSKGVFSKIKNSNCKFLRNSKSKNRCLRKYLAEYGFEKLKLINNKVFSAVYEGILLTNEQFFNQTRELGITT